MSRTASQRVNEMLAKAGHARDQARLCTDDRSRAFWFTMETQWRSRARIELEISEQLDGTAERRRNDLREEMRELLERTMAPNDAGIVAPEGADWLRIAAEATSLAQHTEDHRPAAAETVDLVAHHTLDLRATVEAPSLAPPLQSEDLRAAVAQALNVELLEEAEDPRATAEVPGLAPLVEDDDLRAAIAQALNIELLEETEELRANAEAPGVAPPVEGDDLRAAVAQALNIELPEETKELRANAESPGLAPPVESEDFRAAVAQALNIELPEESAAFRTTAEAPDLAPFMESEDDLRAPAEAPSLAPPQDPEPPRPTRSQTSHAHERAEQDETTEAQLEQSGVFFLSDYRDWREFRRPLGRS